MTECGGTLIHPQSSVLVQFLFSELFVISIVAINFIHGNQWVINESTPHFRNMKFLWIILVWNNYSEMWEKGKRQKLKVEFRKSICCQHYIIMRPYGKQLLKWQYLLFIIIIYLLVCCFFPFSFRSFLLPLIRLYCIFQFVYTF